jgi:hypothetical protein
MIILASLVALIAIVRLISAIFGGIKTAPDITYYLCRPFFFPMSMMFGFLGWLILFAAAGWAINFIITFLLA